MNRSFKGFTLFLLTFLLLVLFVNHINKSSFKKLKSGEYTLVCNLPSGQQAVSPDKIVDLIDGHIYIFTNGYSRSCKVIKVPYESY